MARRWLLSSRFTVMPLLCLQFINALEIVLQKMSATSFPFERVAAISGSGQQHGSAYFRRGARDMLRSLKPGTSLLKQLEGKSCVHVASESRTQVSTMLLCMSHTQPPQRQSCT